MRNFLLFVGHLACEEPYSYIFTHIRDWLLRTVVVLTNRPSQRLPHSPRQWNESFPQSFTALHVIAVFIFTRMGRT